MSDEVKSFSITGSAALDYAGGSKKRGRRTVKKSQGGDLGAIPISAKIAMEAPSQVAQAAQATPTIIKGGASPSVAAAAAPINPSTWLKAPVSPVPPQVHPQVQPPTQEGGAKHFKVELKKKVHTKKVQLHPKKGDAPKTPLHKKHQTRKIRKVVLGVNSLHKRITRAKKVHKKVKDMPLDKLKELLIAKKLIKPTSKAPESILRQIAADSQIVAGKNL